MEVKEAIELLENLRNSSRLWNSNRAGRFLEIINLLQSLEAENKAYEWMWWECKKRNLDMDYEEIITLFDPINENYIIDELEQKYLGCGGNETLSRYVSKKNTSAGYR